MTTERQAIANRQNALQSTGPKTPEGKAVSKWNALRHGLRSEAMVLPDEDVEEYQAFDDALLSELAPVGQLETMLADRIVGLAWRLRRMGRLESDLLAYGFYGELARRAREGPSQSVLDDMLLSIGHGVDEQAGAEALEETRRATTLQNAPSSAAAVGMVRDEHDGMAKLARYESAVERSFFKTLDHLHRLQQCRPDPGADDDAG